VSGSLLLALRLLGGEASAQVTSVTVDSSRPYEEGSGYTYVEATMRGTVQRPDGSSGSYAVPMILIYPPAGGNGSSGPPASAPLAGRAGPVRGRAAAP
jgi:hypothetical protein